MVYFTAYLLNLDPATKMYIENFILFSTVSDIATVIDTDAIYLL